jgi:hypothetical protein|tara:strand:+ start:923 stop:1825 length:903 start_codon:yes stop_codon:yes gene_type:complete
MTQLTTIDTNNYAAMAKAMGIASESASQKEKVSTLARLRINHSPIMGQTEVKGKMVNMEVVSGGTYKLEIPDGETYYASSIKMRPFLQRFMYKRFVRGMGDAPNRYIKTLMNDDLNVDLKDNDGGFNCGKPAGYIKDFKALPEKTQELIRQIKRVRVVLGTVELNEAITSNGDNADIKSMPFIWEIDNRDAFKTVGESFTSLAKMQRLPVQHIITANTQERKLPNGNAFYLPVVSLDVSKTINITDKDHAMFADFMSWIDNYNSYIADAWAKKAKANMDEDDVDVVDSLVDIEIEEDEVA